MRYEGAWAGLGRTQRELAKKKAVVATARKLAVVALSLLKSGENYEIPWICYQQR